jgi:hypothetical protein
VKSSILIDSYPLFTSDKWDNGTAGWIHTPYDNSTSSQTPGGVKADQLESHTQVAALSTMRVLSTLLSPFLIQVYSVTSIVCAAAAVLIYLKRTRVTASLRKLTKSVLSNIGMRQLLYIIILTVLFLFLSFALYMKIGRTEIIDQGYPVPVNVTYFGAPLSMFGIIQPSSETGTSLESQIEWTQDIGGRLIFQQGGLLLNTALFAFLAFVLTYLVMKLTRRREYAGL